MTELVRLLGVDTTRGLPGCRHDLDALCDAISARTDTTSSPPAKLVPDVHQEKLDDQQHR
jgi:hypothetical protein